MTAPESPGSDLEAKAAAADETSPEIEPTPPPEPWTPERVLEWNAYYDLYVVLGVLLLVFVASANRITDSQLWTQLQAGRLIAAKAAPVVTDPFSYTMEGRRWRNVPWLFEWGHSLLFQAGHDLAPMDKTDPAGSEMKAEQYGAGVLIALTALVRVATALLLLGIRRPGSSLWWPACCAVLALGLIANPAGVLLGGIGGPAQVAPETWGILLLTLELLLLHRTIALGRRGVAFGLIPVFLAWANLDPSFLVGLIFLAAVVIGRLFRTRGVAAGPDPLPFGRGLALLAACALVVLANPLVFGAYRAALDLFLQLLGSSSYVTYNQLSFFGKSIRKLAPDGSMIPPLLLYYLVVVGLGLATFALNRRHFAPGRLLVYLTAAALWGAMLRFGPAFAIVFAATAALNGQEWWYDRFGAAGRLGTGWALWSSGGRAVTIILVFAGVTKGLTGWQRSAEEPRFGFTFSPDDFSFEAADYLRTAPLEGRVLNTTAAQGDALIWRASDRLKTFVDSREHLFPAALQTELQDLRLALRDDAVERWKPILDSYRVTAVMIRGSVDQNTYRRLSQSPNWIAFYDDGKVVLFGRADAPKADLAYFRANRLDPAALAFRRATPTPPFDRPPTAVTWLDSIFQARTHDRPQPHTEAAQRWLQGEGLTSDAPGLPSPARCLLAIREARTALAKKPDDTFAYRILAEAYQALMVEEAALLAGLTLTPENAERVPRVAPRPSLQMTRYRQRIAALNYAIQTTPPPSTPEAKDELKGLQFQLYQIFATLNYRDLARDRLQGVLAGGAPSIMAPERAQQYRDELARLDREVGAVQERMNELTVEQQAGPLQRANVANQLGTPGLAIQELEEALQININPAAVKPLLLELYSNSGQPDRALELLGANFNDPTLGSEAGVSALRQGQVHFLLGSYDIAMTLWLKNAIPQLRYDRNVRALSAAQSFLRGDAKGAASIELSIPSQISSQGSWEYDLALCMLEGGRPKEAGEQFTKALTISPNLTVRPIIAYYLEQLGQPVPPRPRTDAEAEPVSKPGELPEDPFASPMEKGPS